MAAYAYFDQNGNLKEFISDKSIRQGNLNSGNQILVFMEPETFDYSDKFIKCTYLDVDTKEVIGTFPIRITEYLVNEALPTFENYDPKYFVSGKTYPFIVLDVPNEVMSLSGSKALSLSMSQLINGNQQVYLVYKSMITFYVDESVIQFTQPISRSEFEFLLQKVAEVETEAASFHYIAGDGIEIDNNTSAISLNLTRLSNILLDALYPVGAIYMSLTQNEATKDTVGKYGCPIAELGGTWERVQGKFLLGAVADDSNQTELTIKMGYYRSANGYYYWEASDGARRSITPGSENYDESNGESRHILTENEMPTHKHDAYLRLTGNQTVDLANPGSAGSGGTFRGVSVGESWSNLSINVTNRGGGASHNNMPPYQIVYMWKRVEDAEELDADLNIRLAPRSAPVVEEQPEVEESVPVVDESINAPVESETVGVLTTESDEPTPEFEQVSTEEVIEPVVTPEEDEYFEENQEEPVSNGQLQEEDVR